jgi:hypothetical protein
VSRVVGPTVGFSGGSFMDKPKCLILAHRNRVADPGGRAARSKAYVCGRSLAGIVSSNLFKGIAVSVVNIVRAQVQVFVQRSPAECGVSECDRVQQ